MTRQGHTHHLTEPDNAACRALGYLSVDKLAPHAPFDRFKGPKAAMRVAFVYMGFHSLTNLGPRRPP